MGTSTPVHFQSVVLATLMASAPTIFSIAQADDGGPVAEDTPASQPSLRPPLLREGAFLQAAPGQLLLDARLGFWVFDVEPENLPTTTTHRLPVRFIMLPCTKLNQMQRTVEASSLETRFLMTGRVLAYRDHNYLLPLDAPLLEQSEPKVDPPDSSTASTAPVEGGSSQSPEQLIQSIRDDVPIARSLAPIETDELSQAQLDALTTEGKLLVARRGRVRRNSRGGWDFVFDADAQGSADAPMTLLPCLLLERLQQAADRRADNPVTITGEVFTYRGRNYMLPTMFRHERSNDNIR